MWIVNWIFCDIDGLNLLWIVGIYHYKILRPDIWTASTDLTRCVFNFFTLLTDRSHNQQ